MEETISAVEEALLSMHGRILRCPVGENPDDCPLHEVRTWPMEKRIAWLESKSDEEIVSLYKFHVGCLEQKLTTQSD